MPPRRSTKPLSLDSLRVRIDDLDRRLVELLNQRASLVVEVGKVKQQTGVPIYAPHREAEVLSRVLARNKGPLSQRSIEGVYREIMSSSFALERPLSIGYLGPPGSFSHLAAVRHFGSSVEFADLHEIDGVFTEVQRGHVDYGLVPIENSIHGGIVETLDSFARAAGRVHIYAEVQLEVHHALLANCDPASIRRIHSKPEVFGQCRQWLATQYPLAELVPAPSSSRAVQLVSELSSRGQRSASASRDGASAKARGRRKVLGPDGDAAIGSTLAGKLYDVNILFEKIEDNPNNITRFFVLSRHLAKPSGDDKTSIMFKTRDKPGALVAVLAEFERAGINLTHIDKRPSARTNWTYSFFVDAQVHSDEPRFARAARRASSHCEEWVVLGSYPRSRRIL